jgi:O-antigen/teichoic acid export membrane protein
MVLGLLAAILLAAATPFVVTALLRIPTPTQAESVRTFYLLAAGIPIVIVTSGLRGILEAHQRFDLVNVIRLPLGVLTYLGPVLVLPLTNDVSAIVSTLILVRAGGLLAYGTLCVRVMPYLIRGPQLGREHIGAVLHMGGWMTASNIVSPVMSYLDRFLVGAILSLSAVAYYATPNEVVTRLLIVPSALVGVLFPAFAAAHAAPASDNARLYRRGYRLVFVLFFPLSLILINLASPALALWFGNSFAEHSSTVLQWLALGMFFNALATVPFTFIQGIGRADITAKIHLIELPIYLGLLFGLIRSLGIEGVAIAWSVRTGLDMLALTIVSQRLLGAFHVIDRSVSAMVVGAILFLTAVITWPPLRSGVILTGALLAFTGASFLLLLSDQERTAARRISQQAPWSRRDL